MSLAAATDRLCKVCGTLFHPRTSLASVCSPPCAIKLGKGFSKQRRESTLREAKQTRERRAALVSFAKLEYQCRKIVQKIARIRDRDQGCISCDKPASWDGQWHGSHFRTHAACSALQFHLWNINKACWIDNKLYSGRIDQYELGLIERYGQERVDWLKAQPKGTSKHTPEYRAYLERFKKVMGKRLRRMEKRI